MEVEFKIDEKIKLGGNLLPFSPQPHSHPFASAPLPQSTYLTSSNPEMFSEVSKSIYKTSKFCFLTKGDKEKKNSSLKDYTIDI